MTQNNRERMRQADVAKAKSQRLTRIVGVAAAVLAVVLIGVFAVVLMQQNGKGATASSVIPPNATAAQDGIIITPGKPVPGAPLVELFVDYQCPVCKQFEGFYGAALKTLAESGQIELHYRTMTFLDNNLNNDASLRAGIAAVCSDIAGTYSAFHDEIFANQPATEGDGYTDAVLRDTIPGKVGITGEALTSFQACYDKQLTKAFVSGTNDKAQQASVNATPTVHVNGKDLPLKTIATVSPDKLGDLIKQNA